MVGFIKPHHPYDPPASWSGMYAPEDLTLLPGWTAETPPQDLEYHMGTHPHQDLTEKKLRLCMAYYYASVSQIDFHVGRMIECLKRKGLYDDTLILFTSDHGDYQGFHHMVGKRNYMYDSLAKVPLIIKYPDQALAGETSDELVSNIDVAPTILRAAGSDVPDTMKGFDLIQKGEGQRELVFAEEKAGEHLMVRSHARKLLLCRSASQSLFFDLVNDPMELNNLYEDPAHRQEVEEYTQAGTEWVASQHPVTDDPGRSRPLVSGDNVPALDDGHREDMLEYFRREMKGV
jgi:arylsulfatase A-like enzyme